MSESPRSRYGRAAIAIHWLTALLVVAGFALGPGGSEQRVYAAANDTDRALHEVIGLAVLALTLLRLAWRAFARPPRLESAARWMLIASRIVQASLYALLVAVPLTAIAGAWLEGHALTLGVLGNVPPPVAEDHALGETIARVHTYLGDTIVWLAGFHAAAALFHHFILRDGVLSAMLPAGLARRLSGRRGPESSSA
ncbi:MAG: cytochrome b [Usitatibacter sp.]